MNHAEDQGNRTRRLGGGKTAGQTDCCMGMPDWLAGLKNMGLGMGTENLVEPDWGQGWKVWDC